MHLALAHLARESIAVAVGMQLAALAFVVSAIVEAKINAAPAHTVSFLWQLPQIFIITTAESECRVRRLRVGST